MPKKDLIASSFLLLILSGCSSVETTTTLATPVTGQIRSAGPGDTVVSFQSRRSLPNAFGNAANAFDALHQIVGIKVKKRARL